MLISIYDPVAQEPSVLPVQYEITHFSFLRESCGSLLAFRARRHGVAVKIYRTGKHIKQKNISSNFIKFLVKAPFDSKIMHFIGIKCAKGLSFCVIYEAHC